MKRIKYDKYYTNIDIANYCWDKVIDIIGEENVSEIIEPACGDGAFFHHHKYSPHFGIDIEPEILGDNIITDNFLDMDINYLLGRLCITNPPYGRCLNLAQKFYKKCVNISDYVALILPISQLNNSQSFYEFDLIYSEDLGSQHYTDRDLHCCFNIYRRPLSGEINKKKVSRLKDISIYRQDSSGYSDKDFDLRMCYWGNGSAGKILSNETYSAEYKIKIHNDLLKDDIIELLTNYDWKEYLNCIAMRKIQQFHIINILKDNIPDIK